ncbi:MAG: J domain-containing protein [Deltaproteobacteria bacterium]|jgi:hypothetical protein|nr:J domain-containing protein [Deltaproteobacteria bacterium]
MSLPAGKLSRNPFEIFGLTQTLVGELSERELFGVLKSLYRGLLKAFHPDTGRDKGAAGPSRAVELNLAFEALNLEKNQTSFRRYRKAYLATHPSRVLQNAALLRDRLQCQLAREERLAEGFFGYLLQGVSLEGLAGAEPPTLKAKNVLLGLQDVAIKNNVRHASWLLGSNYKNLRIDQDGLIQSRAVGRRGFLALEDTFLLGCVPKSAVSSITPLLERCEPSPIYKCPALSEFDPQALPQVTVKNLISQNNFKKHLLSSLKPILLESSYLFSLNRPEFLALGLIRLEGVIIKLETLPTPRDEPEGLADRNAAI